jgi:uncharacterized membrane protein YtjA (UPF0391 family)
MIDATVPHRREGRIASSGGGREHLEWTAQAADHATAGGTFRFSTELTCASAPPVRRQRLRSHMLGWAVTFLVIALIAAVLGFGGIAGVAIEIAKIIFFVALLLFVISAVFGLISGRGTGTAP